MYGQFYVYHELHCQAVSNTTADCARPTDAKQTAVRGEALQFSELRVPWWLTLPSPLSLLTTSTFLSSYRLSTIIWAKLQTRSGKRRRLILLLFQTLAQTTATVSKPCEIISHAYKLTTVRL